jgi:hypothetical protein
MSKITLGAEKMAKGALVIEELVAEAAGGAVDLAREAGYRDGHAAGYAVGRRDEREHWRARLRKLLDEQEEDTRAGVGATAPRQPSVGRGEAVVAPMTGAEGTAGDGLPPPPEAETPAQAGGVTPPPEPPTDQSAAAPKAADPAGPAEAEGVEQPSPPPQEEPERPTPLAPQDDDEDGRGDEVAEQAGESGAEPEVHAAPAPPPAAPPAPPAVGGSDWRTPARETRLRELWTMVLMSHRQIWDELKKVPGPAMPRSHANLVHWAKRLELPDRPGRPADDARPIPEPPAAPSTASPPAPAVPVPNPPPAPAPGPQTTRPQSGSPPKLPAPSKGRHNASFRQIKEWAAYYGIAYNGANVDAVNRRRKLMGLLPVVQDEALTALDEARR